MSTDILSVFFFFWKWKEIYLLCFTIWSDTAIVSYLIIVCLFLINCCCCYLFIEWVIRRFLCVYVCMYVWGVGWGQSNNFSNQLTLNYKRKKIYNQVINYKVLEICSLFWIRTLVINTHLLERKKRERKKETLNKVV